MESALYGIYALVVFLSEILLVRWAHSFDFWYVNNSCVDTVRQHFAWSILYIHIIHNIFRADCYHEIFFTQAYRLLISCNTVEFWKSSFQGAKRRYKRFLMRGAQAKQAYVGAIITYSCTRKYLRTVFITRNY